MRKVIRIGIRAYQAEVGIDIENEAVGQGEDTPGRRRPVLLTEILSTGRICLQPFLNEPKLDSAFQRTFFKKRTSLTL